jgi:hypothetical protein
MGKPITVFLHFPLDNHSQTCRIHHIGTTQGVNIMYKAFEIINPSFSDIPLDKQIEFCINDWQCDDEVGRAFFGQTKEAAEAACAAYNARG